MGNFFAFLLCLRASFVLSAWLWSAAVWTSHLLNSTATRTPSAPCHPLVLEVEEQTSKQQSWTGVCRTNFIHYHWNVAAFKDTCLASFMAIELLVIHLFACSCFAKISLEDWKLNMTQPILCYRKEKRHAYLILLTWKGSFSISAVTVVSAQSLLMPYANDCLNVSSASSMSQSQSVSSMSHLPLPGSSCQAEADGQTVWPGKMLGLGFHSNLQCFIGLHWEHQASECPSQSNVNISGGIGLTVKWLVFCTLVALVYSNIAKMLLKVRRSCLSYEH